MADLHNNEVLASLREHLIAKPQPTEEHRQQVCTPDEISISIYEKRTVLFLPTEFAHTVADEHHRPAIHFQGDRMFLSRDKKTPHNFRRIGTKIDDGQTVQFSIEHSACDGLEEWLGGLECGKSRVDIKWFAKGVWHIDFKSNKLNNPRKIAKRGSSKFGRTITGVIPMGDGSFAENEEPNVIARKEAQEVSEERKAPLRADPVADRAPAQPEPPEAAFSAAPDISKLRSLLAEANRIKLATGGDLQFSLDESGLIRATLNLI